MKCIFPLGCQRKFSICISFCSMCDGNLRGVSTPQSSAYVILLLNDNPDCSRGKENRSFFSSLFSDSIPHGRFYVTLVVICNTYERIKRH